MNPSPYNDYPMFTTNTQGTNRELLVPSMDIIDGGPNDQDLILRKNNILRHETQLSNGFEEQPKPPKMKP